MSQQDARRLSLILLLTPFLLWIILLIILPHLGIAAISLREKIAPRVYTYSRELEVVSKLVDRAVSSVKTTLNTQV